MLHEILYKTCRNWPPASLDRAGTVLCALTGHLHFSDNGVCLLDGSSKGNLPERCPKACQNEDGDHQVDLTSIPAIYRICRGAERCSCLWH